MNSAPSRIKSAATDTSDEIRNSAEGTAFRAMTVSRPASIAAIEKTQKKTDSQPERIICSCETRKNYLSFVIGHLSFVIGHLSFVHCVAGGPASNKQRIRFEEQNKQLTNGQ